MRKTILVLLMWNCAVLYGQSKKADSILNIVIGQQLCFRTADKELDKLASAYQLKFNFNRERMSKYELKFDFNNDKISTILKVVCRVTGSKYLIGVDNTIYLLGNNEKYTPEVALAVEEVTKQVEQVRTVAEDPKKFHVTVSGKITDFNSGEPLPNVNIYIQGSQAGGISNVDGYFTLHDVPSDTAILEFSNIGYVVNKVFLSPKKQLDSLQVQMVTLKTSLDEVVVVSKRAQSFKLNQKVSMIKMTPALIENLPSVGEKDVFRSFQLMPGISAANENSSGLYVRGGTPDQSLVLYDGFTVYNVEHMFGFFSAFNSNAIKDISLYKGGFESKYGGRLSSVVDINGKEGNTKALNGGVDLSMMGINMYADGPLGKNMFGIINFRRSFKTALYNKLFDKYSGQSSTQNTNGNFRGGRTGNGQNTQSYFYDVNGRFTWKPTSKDVLSFSIYNGKDNLDNSISPQVNSFFGGGRGFGIDITDVTDWGNTGGSLKWSKRWNQKFFTNTLVSYSNYFSNRDRSSNMTRTDTAGNEVTNKMGTFEDNNLLDYSAKTDMEYKLSKTHTLEFGSWFTYNDIKYSYAQNDTSKLIDRHTTGQTLGIYIQDRLSLLNDKLEVTPGLRINYFSPTAGVYYEPRLNASYDISNRVKLKGSVGKYYQFAKRVVREDILQGSRDFWALADGNKLPVSSAVQLIAGASWENEDWLFDVEAYNKNLSGLSEYSLRYQIRPGNLSYSENFFEGTSYARGIDWLVQKKFGKYNGWIAYTLGEAVNNYPVYGTADFYASNDVRHEFKTVHTYKWRGFDFGLTFIYASGKPYTAPSGGYTITLLDGTTKDVINVGSKNSSRLPAYHRLDLSATYHFGRVGKGNGSIGISAFNVYNRSNVWYKNYEIVDGAVIETNVNYLSFTPNLTFTYKFR